MSATDQEPCPAWKVRALDGLTVILLSSSALLLTACGGEPGSVDAQPTVTVTVPQSPSSDSETATSEDDEWTDYLNSTSKNLGMGAFRTLCAVVEKYPEQSYEAFLKSASKDTGVAVGDIRTGLPYEDYAAYFESNC